MTTTVRKLIVGSITGVQNKKEAIAHTKGMAERMCDALDLTWFQVKPWRDSVGRSAYLYEIQEGGDTSVLDSIEGQLAAGETVLLELADNHYAEITDDAGTVITVLHDRRRPEGLELTECPSSGKKLKSYRGNSSEVAVGGAIVGALGVGSFLVTLVVAFVLGTFVPDYPMPTVQHKLPNQALIERQDQLAADEFIRAMRFSAARNAFEFEVGRATRSARHSDQSDQGQSGSERPQPTSGENEIKWN
jgi:hypothetical protein